MRKRTRLLWPVVSSPPAPVQTRAAHASPTISAYVGDGADVMVSKDVALESRSIFDADFRCQGHLHRGESMDARRHCRDRRFHLESRGRPHCRHLHRRAMDRGCGSGCRS